jgi:hypothetical protein
MVTVLISLFLSHDTVSLRKAAFSGGGKQEHLEVLEKLVRHPRASVALLMRFAAAFSIESDMAMMKLASWLLGRLEPELRRRKSARGGEEETSTPEELLHH